MALWGVAGAATQALMTRQVAPRSAGPVAGRDRERAERVAVGRAVAVHADVCVFIGDNAPFKLPGAPFLLASALVALALVIAARTLATK